MLMIIRIIASIFIVTITAIYNISFAAADGYHYHKAPVNCTKINSHKHAGGDKPHKHRLRCTKPSAIKQVKPNTPPRPTPKSIVKQVRGAVPVWSTPVIHRQQKAVAIAIVKKAPPVARPRPEVRPRPIVHRRSVVSPRQPAARPQSVVRGVVRPLPQRPQPKKVVKQATLVHRHPAIPRCTRAVKHSHKFQTAAHKHSYSCQQNNIAQQHTPRRPQQRDRQPVRSQQRVVNGRINMAVIRREVRATGIYHGPINSVVSPSTRESLKNYKR